LLSEEPVGSPLSMPIRMDGSDLSAVTNAENDAANWA